jgi:hypothetical protein
VLPSASASAANRVEDSAPPLPLLLLPVVAATAPLSIPVSLSAASLPVPALLPAPCVDVRRLAACTSLAAAASAFPCR